VFVGHRHPIRGEVKSSGSAMVSPVGPRSRIWRR
jgi:hypothetical protein